MPAQPSVFGRERPAAVGCRAHTGWAVLVVVAEDIQRPEVLLRARAELSDSTGRVRKNAYQASRGLEPAVAAELIDKAGQIAAERAADALDRTLRQATHSGADLR